MLSVIVKMTVTNSHSAIRRIDKEVCSAGAYIRFTAIEAAVEGMQKHVINTIIPTLYFFLKETYKYLKG